MIKKSKIGFIISVILILLFVFSALFLTIFFFSANNATEHISDRLNSIYQEYKNNGVDADSKNLIIKINDDGALVISGKDYFSNEFISNLLTQQSSSSSGSIGTVYYISVTVEEVTHVIALDFSEFLSTNAQFNVNVLITCSILFLIALILVLLAMQRLVYPINQVVNGQKQFISDAGHELKTPLTIISANADVLSNTVNSKYLNSIKSQTNRLNLLVSNLLTLAKLDEDAPRFNKENFSLSSAVTEAVLPFEELAFESGKTLFTQIADNINLVGDRQAVITIVNILVDNAVKHSSKRANIKLELSTKNSKNVLTVYNEGSQVLDENSDKIFERFYRADFSRARDDGGSGLGLAIAKKLADANGFTIFADSKYQESMTITVIF